MTLTIHEVEQGSQNWLDLRCGMLTASTIGQLISPKTIKPTNNDTSRALTTHLVAERITGYVEPTFVSADMERGNVDEPVARDIYSQHYAPAVEAGFMVRDGGAWNKLGYSPDGLVGDDGLIEIKSRRQKKHLATILANEVPVENMAQIQTGLLVSGRAWLDYVSYCGGMPLYVKRVLPDQRWFDAIEAALEQFNKAAAEMQDTYYTRTRGAPITERALDIGDLTF